MDYRAEILRLHDAAAKAGAGAIDPDVVIASAGEAMRVGSWDSAASLVEAALVLDPDRAEAWSLRGALEEHAGRKDAARHAYEMALSLDDRDLPAAVALAALHVEANELEKARALLNWIITEDALTPELRSRAVALKDAVIARRGASS